MKNALFISMLLLNLCACSTPAAKTAAGTNLLNFVDLATEITVTHEKTEATAAVTRDADDNSTD